jgi:hypothetical protein
MTEKEIMEALLQGKKITKNGWNSSAYVKLDEKGNLIDEEGVLYSLLFSLNCDDEDGGENNFEEYIECVDYFTALNHMLDGGKAKRLVFNANTKLHCNIDGIISDENNYTITLDRADYKTKDWILL